MLKKKTITVKPKPRPKLEDLTENQQRRLLRTYISNLSPKEKTSFLNKAIKNVYPKSFPKKPKDQRFKKRGGSVKA